MGVLYKTSKNDFKLMLIVDVFPQYFYNAADLLASDDDNACTDGS